MDRSMTINWHDYQTRLAGMYDELLNPCQALQPAACSLRDYLSKLDDSDLSKRKNAAELAIQVMGITFTVYTEGGNIDRNWPFDILPRIIDLQEWEHTEAGLKQRLTALNLFLNDLYNEQKILKDGIVPSDIVLESKDFRQQCMGITPPHGVWANICGSDLVRDKSGTLYVLEDNLRVPSGVSYMLENRLVMKRTFPDLFGQYSILPVDDYPAQLYEMLLSLAPSNRRNDDPEVVVMTPGIYNSAYFEHAYLAQQMGVELVQGSDLVVGANDCVYMRNVDGLKRVDVIYRRIDDWFMDPEAFNPESTLGVPGLMRAWRQGRVALANAPGSGVADDKVVYAFVPKIIKYYLDEDPIIPNVPTYLCMIEKERKYVLEHLSELVVKPANESGGYGMLIGPKSTSEEQQKFKQLIQENPRNYIAQPTLSLSTAPTLCEGQIAPRHVDLRPFILQGETTAITTGGLTRVALREGSLVVNSSQGGGSKDTWVMDMRL